MMMMMMIKQSYDVQSHAGSSSAAKAVHFTGSHATVTVFVTV